MSSPIRKIVRPRQRDLGGFVVRRALPFGGGQMVGPFIFLDEMGPAVFGPGEGMDVRPHPHIGLATVTYLFDGAIVHRDSLGIEQRIEPGAVNWMTAGRGIVHSERTDPADRATGFRIHGLQSWVALPSAHQEVEPAFHHHPADTLPKAELDGAEITLVAGNAFGLTSPVQTLSPLFYVDVELSIGSSLTCPRETGHEAAIYLVSGSLAVGPEPEPLEPGELAIFDTEGDCEVCASADSRFVFIGGAPVDGPRHIWWNFVSDDLARIERAKADWSEGRFPSVPGETEWIPLPEA